MFRRSCRVDGIRENTQPSIVQKVVERAITACFNETWYIRSTATVRKMSGIWKSD